MKEKRRVHFTRAAPMSDNFNHTFIYWVSQSSVMMVLLMCVLVAAPLTACRWRRWRWWGLTDTPICDAPPGVRAWQYTDMTDIHSTPPPLLPSLLQSTMICITLMMPRPPVEQCLHLWLSCTQQINLLHFQMFLHLYAMKQTTIHTSANTWWCLSTPNWCPYLYLRHYSSRWP